MQKRVSNCGKVLQKSPAVLQQHTNKSGIKIFPKVFTYRPFHKTLPRSNAFVNWISVRFYETGCIRDFNLINFRKNRFNCIFILYILNNVCLPPIISRWTMNLIQLYSKWGAYGVHRLQIFSFGKGILGEF